MCWVPRTHRPHYRPHYRRSRTSRHVRPLWYGHFQKPARSSVVFGVPSERRLQYHSPSGQMMLWRMKDHSASADSSQFDSPVLASADSSQCDPPVFWYWLMQPTTVSAWTHQWRPESRRLVLLDRPELPWRTLPDGLAGHRLPVRNPGLLLLPEGRGVQWQGPGHRPFG